MKLKFNPLTGKFDWIVSKLSELASRPHSDLTDVTPDQHHAQLHGSADHLPESDATAIHDNVAGEIAAIPEKSAPASTDLLLIEDSAAANTKKKAQVGNLQISHAIDDTKHTGTLDIGDPQLPAPPAGYPADVAAIKADGTSTQVARADHVHAHGTDYLPDAHHAQAHDDSDHTGPSRVAVQDEGVIIAERAVLNFIGDGVSVSDDAVNGRVNINVPGVVESGHQIQEDGTTLPQRSSLNFAAGIIASDNQASDRTDVNIDYGVDADVSNADASISSSGSLSRVARADHKHSVSVATPIDLGDVNAEGSIDALSRADHVHKRSVRVKSGTSDLTRNALNIAGLGVIDDAVNDEVDVVHDTSSPGHHAQVHTINGSDHIGTLDVGDAQLPAPPTGYPADVAAAKSDGTSLRVARADHVHAHGSGYLPDAHHAQAHGDSDHTGPSRVAIQDEGTLVAERTTLNFVGDSVTVSDDAQNGRVNITISGGGGGTGGHEIQEDGTVLPQRAALNFGQGLVAQDNAQADRTDVNVDYSDQSDVVSVDAGSASAGQLLRLARADHKHNASVGTPVGLADSNQEGSAATLARSDHVHKRSVRVKSGSSDLARNALDISGLSVADDSTNDEINIVHDVSSAGHHAQIHAIDSADHVGTLDIGDSQLPAPPAGYVVDVAAAGADGISTRVARADHVHAHGAGYLPDAHHPRAHDHSAAADGDALSPAVLNLPQAASPAQTVEGQVVWDSTNDKLTVGDGASRKVMAREDQAVMDGDAAGGELTGTYPNPAVATVHAGSAHHAQVHAVDGSDHTGVLDIGDPQLPAPPDGYPAGVAASKSDGTSARVARADHVHAHGTGYLPDAHHPQAHSDADHTGPSRVEIQDEGTTVGTRAVLNFTGAGVSVSDDSTNGRININIPGGSGGGGGHQIQEDGTALPQRSALNFAAGLVASDNQALDRTDVSVDYGVPVDLGGANAEGSSSALARADHVHKRAVGVYFPNGSTVVRGLLQFNGVSLLDESYADRITIFHNAFSAGHHSQSHAIDSSDHTGTLDIGDAQLPAPPEGYVADVAATKADGISPLVARADHVHAHGSGYLPDAHHPRAHSDTDHTGPSRVEVQGEGVTVGIRTVLNFTGVGVSVSDDPTNDRLNIDIPGGGTGGGGGTHAIDGSDHTGTLDIGDPQLPAPPTGYPADVAAIKGDGTSTLVARADHVHAHGTGYLPDAHHAQVHGIADHTGVVGKVYTTLLWYIDGGIALGDGQGATPYLDDVVDKIRIRAAVDTAPVGQALIAEVNYSTNRVAWEVVGTVTIEAGAMTGETTLTAGTLQPGWYRLDINQVGSITAGSDLTVMFVCKRPVTAV